MIAPSSYFQAIFRSAFRLYSKDFPVLGYPRMDRLLSHSAPYQACAPKVLYAPTFRGRGEAMHALRGKASPTQRQWGDLDKLLHAHHAQMRVQYHPVDAQSQVVTDFQSIKPIEVYDDFYAYLQTVDILITDYSGLMFDFLLTKKPVICVIGDIDDYLSKDREIYRHPCDIPGVYVCQDWNDVHQCLLNLFEKGQDPGMALSEKDRRQLYAFEDCEASRRIVQYIQDKIN